MVRGSRVGRVAAVCAWVVLLAGAPAAADSGSTVLSGRRIAQQSNPAMHLVETDFTATLTVYADPKLDPTAVDAFVARSPAAQAAVSVGDRAAFAQAVIQAVVADPRTFIARGDPSTVHPEVAGLGSGFAITPDGYLVTNDHVVAPADDEIKQHLVEDGLSDQVKAATDQIVAELKGQIPDALLQQLVEVVSQFISDNARLSGVQSTVYVGGGPVLDRQLKGKTNAQQATVVAHGDEYPGKDVAILKIDGHNLPTLPLGDDTKAQQGDQLYAIGYPADATFISGAAPSAQVSPTLTGGKVSNKLPSQQGGFTLIETDAVINHGSSGGPALNDSGEVIGITTAGTQSQGGGQFAFIIPTSVIREFVQKANVTPSQAPGQLDFNKALDLVEHSHLKAAQKLLLQAKAANPTDPYVQAQLDQVGEGIAAGRDKPVSSFPTTAVILGGGGGLLVVLLIVLLLMLRSRRRDARAVEPAAAPGFPSPPGPPMGALPTGPPPPAPTWPGPAAPPPAAPTPTGGWGGPGGRPAPTIPAPAPTPPPPPAWPGSPTEPPPPGR